MDIDKAVSKLISIHRFLRIAMIAKLYSDYNIDPDWSGAEDLGLDLEQGQEIRDRFMIHNDCVRYSRLRVEVFGIKN